MRKAVEARKAGVEARRAFGFGLPGPKIIEDARQQQASLIVMAAHSPSAGSRKLGSTVEEVILYRKLPALLVAGVDSTGELFQTAPEEAEITPRQRG